MIGRILIRSTLSECYESHETVLKCFIHIFIKYIEKDKMFVLFVSEEINNRSYSNQLQVTHSIVLNVNLFCSY